MSYDCVCDYDPPEFWSSLKPKARKPHECCECSGTIISGERYERVTGKWDGYISTFATCERCFDIRIWVRNNVPCFCWAHGNLDDDAKPAVEEACYRAPGETAGLRFGLHRRMVQRNRLNQVRRAV